MNWKAFLKPTTLKILVFILLLVVSSLFFLPLYVDYGASKIKLPFDLCCPLIVKQGDLTGQCSNATGEASVCCDTRITTQQQCITYEKGVSQYQQRHMLLSIAFVSWLIASYVVACYLAMTADTKKRCIAFVSWLIAMYVVASYLWS